jgi:hypothetical protein
MSDEQKNGENQQGGGNKDHQKFLNNFKKLIALFSGELIFKKDKLNQDGLNEVLEELTKEKRDALKAEFKKRALALIERKQEFDRFSKAEQDKANKAILEKEKEFTKEMESIFGLVEKIGTIEQEYYNTLKGLTTSPTTESSAAQESGTDTSDIDN